MNEAKRILAEHGERSEPRETVSVVKRRRDNKRRVLRMGEFQLDDGRYKFSYQDAFGKRKSVYSWRLDCHDPYPKDRKRDISLREKEAKIHTELLTKVAANGGEFTVYDLAEKYISLKTGMRHNTSANYRFALNIIRKSEFGRKRIDQVRMADAKAFLIGLQQGCGKRISSVKVVRGVLRPAFKMALDDDLVRKNPFDFELVGVLVNDSVVREAISPKQMRDFLGFVKEDKHFKAYYEGIYILFHTGLRISEFVGLTMGDIDMQNREINIDHQLQRTRDMRYVIEKPKTPHGVRKIPMRDDVYECFRVIIENRKKRKVKEEPRVGDYSGFLYLEKNDQPMVALHWEHYFKRIVQKYNSIYKEELPTITPHVCRHTFCSNMAKVRMSPKALQYIMGHSDISVTLNTYTHFNYEDAKEEMLEIKEV